MDAGKEDRPQPQGIEDGHEYQETAAILNNGRAATDSNDTPRYHRHDHPNYELEECQQVVVGAGKNRNHNQPTHSKSEQEHVEEI
mmetsp:Transcript_144465/g.262700  ORF Transcript_144465/g.262700 Transcript_144465/m.262700 type:complete len:85 (+) Transcript_144465:215-469(+)